MAATTSTTFASAIASGTDWREASKNVLEQLESARAGDDGFNFGLLYVSDHLCDDLSSILNLFKSVLNIDQWCGCVAMGVCGNGLEYIDQPAISVMIGRFEAGQTCLFPCGDLDDGKAQAALEPWLEAQDAPVILTHGDPMMGANPAHLLQKLEDLTSGYIIGGLASSRGDHACIAGTIGLNGLCGVGFSQDVALSCSLSQGCAPIGAAHIITRCHDHTILELDGRPALEVFEDDVRHMACARANLDPQAIPLERPEDLPPEYHQMFQGEVHAAFPVQGCDKGEYLVRNLIRINEETKSLDVAQISGVGERVLFVHRDNDSVKKDLARTLCDLHKRIIREQGQFQPKGALYISCVARAFSDFGKADKSGELALVHEIIGDVPLTGFYASGEINAGRLYGYTGILILFL